MIFNKCPLNPEVFASPFHSILCVKFGIVKIHCTTDPGNLLMPLLSAKRPYAYVTSLFKQHKPASSCRCGSCAGAGFSWV